MEIPSPNMLPLSCVYLNRNRGFVVGDLGIGNPVLRTSQDWYKLHSDYYKVRLVSPLGWSGTKNWKMYWAMKPISYAEFLARFNKSYYVSK